MTTNTHSSTLTLAVVATTAVLVICMTYGIMQRKKMVANLFRDSENTYSKKIRLPDLISITSEKARSSGAICKISTEFEFVESSGVQFAVHRLVSRTLCKPRNLQSDQFDPFSKDNIEENLFVKHVGTKHALILNKFNIIDDHVILVTNDYESQEAPLTLADFIALFACIDQIPSVAFFNCGEHSGKSQNHKHLQLIPLKSLRKTWVAKTDSDNHDVPIRALFPSIPQRGKAYPLATVPFANLVYFFELNDCPIAEQAYAAYNEMKASFQSSLTLPQFSYNLVTMKDFIMMIPRRQSGYNGIEVNALGFIGSLLSKDSQQFEDIIRIRPMNLLANVGFWVLKA